MCARLGATTDDLPDSTEQPQRGIVTILCQRKDVLAVEVVVHIAPGVPGLPLLEVIAEHLDRMGLAVVDRAVEFELARVEAGTKQRRQGDAVHGGSVLSPAVDRRRASPQRPANGSGSRPDAYTSA